MALQDPPLPPLTSTFPRLTNIGIPLHNDYRGGESDTIREVPPEWRAALNLDVTELSVPLDYPIFELTDEILACKAEQTVTSERKMRTTRKPAGVFTLLERFTDKDKQFGTRTRTFHFIDDLVSPAIPTATRKVDTKNFGNKHYEQTVEDVPEVFPNLVSAIELTDLIPDIFKAALPVYTREFTEEGIVEDPPVLALGDFEKREEQIDEFNKRVLTKGRAGLDLPQSIIILRHTTEEYGGEITQITGFLDDTEPPVEQGLGIISSEVRNLGDGLFFRQTEKWDTALAWPILVGTEVDPRTGITVGITKQVVDAGTTGGVFGGSYVDVKPIDKWRSYKITSELDPDSLPDPVTWETTVEHRFPNQLNGIAWIWAAASAPFAYDFDMALVLDMVEGYAGPCRAKVTESFYTDAADIPPVNPTIFCPQGHTVGYTWAYAADPSDDCGTCIGIARANARTWSIPPSLHDEIDLSGTVTLDNGEFTNSLPATCPIALPAPGTLITKEQIVERWRFNVFFVRKVEIYVPDCTC